MASRSEQLVVGFPKQQIGAEGLPSALRWPARRAWTTFQISGAATGGGLRSWRPRGISVQELVSQEARPQPRPLPGQGSRRAAPRGPLSSWRGERASSVPRDSATRQGMASRSPSNRRLLLVGPHRGVPKRGKFSGWARPALRCAAPQQKRDPLDGLAVGTTGCGFSETTNRG